MGAFALSLTGCVGPWSDMPSENPVQIRAALAVFVQPGAIATAFLTRPLDGKSEAGTSVPWLDTSNSRFQIDEIDPRCANSIVGQKSEVFHSLNTLSNQDWTYWTKSQPMASCGDSRTWRFHGDLRWNASSPFSTAEPVWVTDSLDIWAETSTSPTFLRGNITGPLELRWSRLALADSSQRALWRVQPQVLANLVTEWNALQAARGDNAQVLALDTTSNPWTFRWFDLDTAILGTILSPNARFNYSGYQTRVVFAAGDTIWLGIDHDSWIRAVVSGTAGQDLYEASHSRQNNFASISATPFANWPNSANWLNLERSYWKSDSHEVWIPIPPAQQNNADLELAVAGTCPGQRTFLHQGGSNPEHLPHGNVSPLDGFFCEVHTDTLTFPVGTSIPSSRTLSLP